MNIEEVKERLIELNAEAAKEFILDLYLHYPDLNQQVETLLLRNDPTAYARAINKRIQSVKRGRKFIDYYASYSFARVLESIIHDIESGLLQSSPKLAFGLVDKFLDTAGKVLDRCDDSNGDISAVYHDATLLWLTSASRWDNSKENWMERVYQMNQQDDYGVLNLLLPNSHRLLSNEQLTQLASRYESELKSAIKKTTEESQFSLLTLNPSTALCSIAEALKDPALFERATLITSPKPNDIQKQSIVKMYIQFEQVDKALEWLNSPWDARFSGDRLRLLDKVYFLKGDNENLKQVRYKRYKMFHEYDDLESYLEVLDKSEKKAAREEAIKVAQKAKNFSTDVAMLFALDEAERAQSIVLNNPVDAANCYYTYLLDFAKKFEANELFLAAAACYRYLLLDILAKAKSKAYGHAANYYKKLKQFDSSIENYAPLDVHETFLQQLKADHGRKKSFWARLN